MSIPRRLVLALRQTRGIHRSTVNASLASTMPSHHQPPVVIIKKDLSRESDDQHDDDDDDIHMKSYMTTGFVNKIIILLLCNSRVFKIVYYSGINKTDILFR